MFRRNPLIVELGRNHSHLAKERINELLNSKEWHDSDLEDLYLHAKMEKVIPVVYHNISKINLELKSPAILSLELGLTTRDELVISRRHG